MKVAKSVQILSTGEFRSETKLLQRNIDKINHNKRKFSPCGTKV